MRIRVLVMVVLLATGVSQGMAQESDWQCDHKQNLDPLPWASDSSKGTTGNPILQKVIFVSFANSSNADAAHAAERFAALGEYRSIYNEQSRQQHGILHTVLEVPGEPLGSTWRLVSDGSSDFQSSGDFGSSSSVETFQRFRQTAWTRSDAWQGELQARVMQLIQQRYDAEYGVGNWQSPLAGADAVLIVVIPDSGGVAENPLDNGATFGAGNLSVKVTTTDARIARVVNDAPRMGTYDAMAGLIVVYESGHPKRNITAMGHYWGHVLGLADVLQRRMGHAFAGSTGAYSMMSNYLPEDEWRYPSYRIIDHPTRVRLGWAAPISLSENLRDVAIRDAVKTGTLYRIPVQTSTAVIDDLPPPWHWVASMREYFLVAFEDGQSSMYGAPAAGLYVWHCLEFKGEHLGTLAHDEPENWVPGDWRCNFMNIDLEVATGRFTDPGTWQVADPTFGYDSLDLWDYRDFMDYFGYWGDPDDLYAPGERSEISFRSSSNPSTYGYGGTAASLAAECCYDDSPVGYVEVCEPPFDGPQTMATAITIKVKQALVDGVVADLLLAPFESVIEPNGGEVLRAGQPVTIRWTTGTTGGLPDGIINTVDLYLDRGPGLGSALIASGVSAHAGQYGWTPTADDLGTACRIRVVAHNVIDMAHVGSDESDGSFSVIEAVAAKFSDVSGVTGLSFDGAPYSGVPLDADGLAENDLAVSATGGEAHVFIGLEVQPSGAPRFERLQTLVGLNLRGVTAVDFDNDGDEDLFLASDTTPKLYRNDVLNGHTVFTDVTSAVGLATMAAGSTAACWGDYDRDGWLDLYVVRSNSCYSEPPDYLNIAGASHRLFRNLGQSGGGFVDVTTATGIAAHAVNGSVSASWGDIDGDGDLDLVAVNLQEPPTGPGGIGTHLFVNQDNGTFSEEFLARFGSEIYYATAAQWADIDNDKDLDLVVSCAQPGSAIYRNDGTGHFPSAAAVRYPELPIPASQGFSGVRVLDYDLDGSQDILWLSRDTALPSRLTAIVPTAAGLKLCDDTAAAGLGLSGAAMGIVAADFTHDGDTDLFLGRPVAAGEYFYMTDAPSGGNSLGRRYVKVKLVSPFGANNRAGVGARVSVTAGTLAQTQIVDGGSGRGGQADRVLTFGLGSYSGPVTVEVQWPSGHVQVDIPLLLSGGGVDETINLIADETPPIIGNVSGAAVVDPVTGFLDWVFSWDTSVGCDPAMDLLMIDQEGIANPCLPGWQVITPTTPGVMHTCWAKASGGYAHSFTIAGMPCSPNCRVRYSVSSGTGPNRATSSLRSKTMKFCPSAQ